ncbi:MAG: SLC13 family permease [Roseiflexus sp.]
MIIVFGILMLTVILFAGDRLRLDVVALIAVLLLLLTGILTPAEALAGFSDPIVLIIAGLFIVGAGLFQTGVADALGQQLVRIAGTGETRLIVAIMLIVACLSAFLSSTGTVAVFLPVVVSLAQRTGISPTKLLLPLAYASLIGGMLTLIGTPPNIVVSNQLQSAGMAPFGFFAFTPVGVVMLAVGIVYMATVGRRLLPARAHLSVASRDGKTPLDPAALLTLYDLPGKLARVQVEPDSPLVGQTLAQANLRARYRVNVIDIEPQASHRMSALSQVARAEMMLKSMDVLLVKGTADDIAHLAKEQQVRVLATGVNPDDLITEETGIVELVLTPRSQLIGRALREARFQDTYHVLVLAILRMGAPLDAPTSRVELRFGDTLLVQGDRERIASLLDERNDFVVVGEIRHAPVRRAPTRRAMIALAIMAGMLILISFEIIPMVTAVLLAAIAMVLTGCLSMEEGYRAINWESVVLIAGMLPMATALDKTGGMSLIASGLTATFGAVSPLMLMTGLFMLTAIFSQFISNTATTVLMAPIALQAANELGVSPYPLLMIIALAASTAFATPVASPVNTLVLGPGDYRFTDFVRVGTPLLVVMLIASLLIVPVLFPL